MIGGGAVDVESAIQALLSAEGVSASAPPVPATLGVKLPHVCIERTGGYEAGPVQDSHQVDFDVYAASDADAMALAGSLCGWARLLAGRTLGGVPCYAASVPTLPYQNPDPRHPNIPRATFKAQLLTRTA